MQTRRNRRSRWGLWLPILGVFACAALAIAIAVISTILSEEDPKQNTTGNTLVYGLTLLPSGFDPHRNSSAELGLPMYNVYDTLIYRHPQTKAFVAGLAERWEISPDGRIYTFHLRQDVKFHDDTPFDADAVGVTIDRILNPETRSQKALALLGPYFLGYVIHDPYTIEFQLSQPFTPLLDGLSQPYLGIASPTALANNNDNTYQFHQVGTGPYRMVEYVPEDRLVLERNRDYTWGPPYYANYSDQSIDRVIFRFYQSPPTRRIGLEAGDVDIVGELPPTDAELLLRNQNFKVLPQPIPGQPLQYYFNTQRFPTDDLRFRQALLFATHREAIVGTVFYDQFSPTAYGPISASTLYYNADVQQLYPYSAERARQLFQSAGYTDSDNDGWLDKGGIPIKLTIVSMNFGFLPEVNQLIQSQWREIGIEVEFISAATFPDLIAAAQAGEFHLLALNDFGVDPSFLNRYYLSNGDSNWSRYSDAELDSWLIQANQTNDNATRQQLYANVQKRIMDEALILPIRDYVSLVGYNTKYDGLIFSAQGWWPLLPNLVLRD